MNQRVGRSVVWVLVAIVLAAASISRVHAQAPPAGNERAATQALSSVEAVNPFGDPQEQTASVDAKRAFARAVDVKPLRDLAVFHNGRVKILQTLANESMQSMVGRKDFVDFKVGKDYKADKFHYDPVFTLMDLAIDPRYYFDKPLIHVEYLPLREAYLEALYTDKDEIEWWKRLGRLKPMDLVRVGEAAETKFAFDQASMRSRSEMRSAYELFQSSWQNFLMVAPPDEKTPWAHLSALPADAPASKAARELGIAWRALDAEKANAAIRTLAAELPKINASQYPTSKRSIEAAYNGAKPFEWGFWLYAVALLLLLLAFGTGRKGLTIAGVTVLFVALGLHAFGFAARSFIAERYAIQNQFESMTGLSLFAVVVGTVIMLIRRQWLFGAASAGVGFMVLVTATQTGIPGASVEREAAILNTSVLLKYHVTTVLISYGLIALGLMVSLFYLGTYYAARARVALGRSGAGAAPAAALAGASGAGAGRVGGSEMAQMSAAALGLDDGGEEDGAGASANASSRSVIGPQRVLLDLDRAQMIVLQLAFWTLGVGILLGAWWADHSWGRWWAFDPKELWALVTWIVYLIVIHVRFGLHGQHRALVTAWLSVVGFIVMLWTYFGVNLLLPGLHAYA